MVFIKEIMLTLKSTHSQRPGTANRLVWVELLVIPISDKILSYSLTKYLEKCRKYRVDFKSAAKFPLLSLKPGFNPPSRTGFECTNSSINVNFLTKWKERV